MVCGFCREVIHFYEDCVCVGGTFFHDAVITDTEVRCKRMRRIQHLLNVEAEILERRGHEMPLLSQAHHR